VPEEDPISDFCTIDFERFNFKELARDQSKTLDRSLLTQEEYYKRRLRIGSPNLGGIFLKALPKKME
jgi:hypothetical protein